MYLGIVEGRKCRVSKDAPNGSVCITGISGSGKSCRQNRIELEEVKKGNTVIAIDFSRNHQRKDIFEHIRVEYDSFTNRIDAVRDGIGIRLFTPFQSRDKEPGRYVNIINSNVQAFSASVRMGDKQKAVLRNAIERAMEIQSKNPMTNELEGLIMALEEIDSSEAQSVYQKLWTVLNSGVIRTVGQSILEKKINIIDLSGLDMNSSEIVAEVLLAYLWHVAYNIGFSDKYGKVIVVLDEFQHCSIRKYSTLQTMLREGRRFGLNLLLTTQTLDNFNREEQAILNQTAVHLYFRPAESEKLRCAKVIDLRRASEWKEQLGRLQRGECIAVGALEVNGIEITRPLILK